MFKRVPTDLDRSAKREHDKLSKLSGADFDREYMKHMLDDHKKDVKDFQKEAKSGKDPVKTLEALDHVSDVAGKAAQDAAESAQRKGGAQTGDGIVGA